MAPQTSIPLPATILGLIGTVFWCVQLVPQIYKSHCRKDTEGLPSTMMLLWASSSMPFGVYAIAQRFNVPLQVQPQCFGLLCTVAWGQCMVYSRGWSTRKAVVACVVLLATIAGLETLFILILRDPYSEGKRWASNVVTFFGALACVIMVAGYIPVPAELIKRRGRVVGISLAFLAVDWSGAFFSLLSLVFQRTFDPLFGTLYALVAGIESVMFLSHGIWLLRTRELRKEAEQQKVAYEEFPPAVEWQSHGWDIGMTRLRKSLNAGNDAIA